MKTSKKLLFKKPTFLVLGLFLALFLMSNSANAQIKVKGIVKGQTIEKIDVLNGANIFLNGTKIGSISNKKGEFTFPQKLKAGDVLIFSYLGFVKKRIKITENSSYLTVILQEDENQMLGALNSNKRYKSKRSKTKE